MQRHSGPHRGYFITSKAVPVKGRFVGRAVVSTAPPNDGRQATVAAEVSSRGTYDDADKAIRAAEFQARQAIDGLFPCWDPFSVPGTGE